MRPFPLDSPSGPAAPPAPVATIDSYRRCTLLCLAACASKALTAGPEGSGRGLPAVGTDTRCRFHHELLTADRFSGWRRRLFVLLTSIRRVRGEDTP